MKNYTFLLLFTASIAVFSQRSHALVASDVASNYGGSWTDGSNGGTGFLPWTLINNNNPPDTLAGASLEDSTAGAGDINTGGVSFALFASPGGAFSAASRNFAEGMAVGETFSLDMAVNQDNGFKGFTLQAGSQGEVFSFSIGSGASVGAGSATLNPGSGTGYNYGGTDAVLHLTFTTISASEFSYEVSRSSSEGFQGTLFSGTVSGVSFSLSGFVIFVADSSGGAPENTFYVNNFNVVPEPSTYALVLLGGAGLLGAVLRRRVVR